MNARDPFAAYLKGAADSAAQQIATETAVHNKRIEFWKGYQSAMQEILDHPEMWPQP